MPGQKIKPPRRHKKGGMSPFAEAFLLASAIMLMKEAAKNPEFFKVMNKRAKEKLKGQKPKRKKK